MIVMIAITTMKHYNKSHFAFDDGDMCFEPRVVGGSRAKRKENALNMEEEPYGWYDIYDEEYYNKPSCTSVNLNKKLQAEIYSRVRKSALHAEVIRSVMDPLPYDIQDYILQLANMDSDKILTVPLKVLHSSNLTK